MADTPTEDPELVFLEAALADCEAALRELLGARWETMAISGKSMSRPDVMKRLQARDWLKARIAQHKTRRTSGIKTILGLF